MIRTEVNPAVASAVAENQQYSLSLSQGPDLYLSALFSFRSALYIFLSFSRSISGLSYCILKKRCFPELGDSHTGETGCGWENSHYAGSPTCEGLMIKIDRRWEHEYLT